MLAEAVVEKSDPTREWKVEARMTARNPILNIDRTFVLTVRGPRIIDLFKGSIDYFLYNVANLKGMY